LKCVEGYAYGQRYAQRPYEGKEGYAAKVFRKKIIILEERQQREVYDDADGD
jgi:hypothetical protein